MSNNYRIAIFLLLILYTLFIIYVGYRNRRSRDSEDFFLAGRRLPAWLLAITFIASWWGGGSAIDLVDQANGEGISTFWIYGVPVLLSTFLMFLFSGGIRRISIMSQPAMMERRYDSRSGLLMALFIVVFMVVGSAVQVIVVGRFFEAILGTSAPVSAIIGTSMVLLYSLFGGFRGVVLTDLLQFCFFLASSVLLLVVAYLGGDGFGGIATRAEEVGRVGFTDFMHNIGDNLAYVITFGASWMVQANVWQRISAARNPGDARKMMLISFVIFIPLYLMVTLTGMLSIGQYVEVPSGGVVTSMVLGLESKLVGSFVFVGLCSAIMSSMDSMFNTGAMTLTVDLYRRYVRSSCSEGHYVWFGRWATVIVAGLAMFIGVKVQSVLVVSWIGADFIASGAFVPLVLGFLWRRGTALASFCSMIFGLLYSTYNLLVVLGVGLPIGWEIASVGQAIIGLCGSFVIYVLVSLCGRGDFGRADDFIGGAGLFRHFGR